MLGVNVYGGSKAYLLVTDKMVVRRSFNKIPLPDAGIRHLNQKAEKEALKRSRHYPSIGPDQDDDREEDDNTPIN